MWMDTCCQGLQWGLGGKQRGENECGRCWVGQLPRHCSRAQWGLKGMQEGILGPKGGTGKGDSLSWQIACLCGSQLPYIPFPLIARTPRLVFHPCPSGCNGVPGCLDGWRCGHYWQPLLECHSVPSSPKTCNSCTPQRGNVPLFRCGLHFPCCICTISHNLFLISVYFFLPFLCVPQIVYSFFPLSPVYHAFFSSFSTEQTGATRPFT